MCGRYRIKDTDRLSAYLRRTFDLPDWLPDYNDPHYNIAPSQDCPAIALALGGDPHPAAHLMRWGFVPAWEHSARPRLAPINAQSEQIAHNGLFRAAVQQRRCLIPADGFYEWLRFDAKTKYPFDFHLHDDRPFVMAGVYEPATADRPATFAILTTAANPLMAPIHDRMPVILDTEAARTWLRRGPLDAAQIASLTRPCPAEEMAAVPISALVNSPRHDQPEILAPVPPPPPRPQQDELF